MAEVLSSISKLGNSKSSGCYLFPHVAYTPIYLDSSMVQYVTDQSFHAGLIIQSA
ncbi:hypothetical protein J6590_097748 [Homalodisca vitripennis]|nr:hypothetical protein J6590_097748 [Homalodisca vitripennis]